MIDTLHIVEYDTRQKKETSHKTDVVILIPHFNNLPGLIKSLKSIDHHELIRVLVVDDGSNFPHIPEYKTLRTEIRKNILLEIINESPNKGIEHALNTGLNYIKNSVDCKYIARLDCGDTCRGNRFEIQSNYLDKNPSIHLVGSWVKFHDIQGNDLYTIKPPANQRGIRKNMQVNCCFIHPSVMYRKEAIKEIGFYPTKFKAAEDYAFFYKFIKNYETANIRKTLTNVELNPHGISITNRKRQLYSRLKVIVYNNKLDYRTFYGVGRTIVLMLVPYKFVEKFKSSRFK